MRVFILLLFAILAYGQTDTITLEANQPLGVDSASASINNPGGNATYYYWVVANYPVGSVTPNSPAIAVDAPLVNASNTITISWRKVLGATNYNVLRTTTYRFPGSCTACVVAAGNTSGVVVDNGSALGNYTMPNSATKATSTITLNNRDFPKPLLQLGLVSTPTIMIANKDGSPIYVGSLPSAATCKGCMTVVSDGSTSTDCVVGGGSNAALCQSNGSTWVAIGGSSGGTAFTAVATPPLTCTKGNAYVIAAPASIAVCSDTDTLTTLLTGGDPTVAGYVDLYPPNDTVNYVGWGTTDVRTNKIRMLLPTTDPTDGQVLSCATPVANKSTCTWITPAAPGGGGIGTIDLPAGGYNQGVVTTPWVTVGNLQSGSAADSVGHTGICMGPSGGGQNKVQVHFRLPADFGTAFSNVYSYAWSNTGIIGAVSYTVGLGCYVDNDTVGAVTIGTPITVNMTLAEYKFEENSTSAAGLQVAAPCAPMKMARLVVTRTDATAGNVCINDMALTYARQ